MAVLSPLAFPMSCITKAIMAVSKSLTLPTWPMIEVNHGAPVRSRQQTSRSPLFHSRENERCERLTEHGLLLVGRARHKKLPHHVIHPGNGVLTERDRYLRQPDPPPRGLVR